MEKAKLLLDFLRALIWPLLVMIVLIVFYGPVKMLISERLEKADLPGASFTFVSGTKRPDTLIASLPQKPKAPDIFFSVLDTSSLRNTTCEALGKAALTQSGFGEVQDNQRGIAFGYDQGFVGAIHCGLLKNFAVITVAGQYEGLSDRHQRLDDAFVREVPKSVPLNR
jgi:hypothetical protein